MILSVEVPDYPATPGSRNVHTPAKEVKPSPPLALGVPSRQSVRVYESPIKAIATLVEVRKPGVYGARLPNGKVTCAHLAKALAKDADSFAAGDQVRLELTPFDFDSARITARINPNTRK